MAARMFREGKYDLILMDVEMPAMDGYQATTEIRRWEKETGAPPAPVLALTAHAFAEMAVRGRDAGFTALLTKPIRKITLLEALVQHGPKNTGVRVTSAPRIVVAVEEGMEDVVPGYLEKRRREVAVYAAALAQHDFDSIRNMAHKMKGTGSGYGFPVLTELGGVMEKAALNKDATHLRESLRRLEVYIESIDLKYIR